MPVVLITGTSSGMGRATARFLAGHGYSVFGGDVSPFPDEPTAGLQTLPLDVCSDDSVKAFVGRVLDQTGRIDAVINNAGYGLGGAVEETSLDEARAQLETNFFGVTRMVKEVLPIMRRQGAGRIINTSSGAGISAGPFHAFYSASKFAVEGFTEALRHEVKPFGIFVSILQPGSFRTHVVRHSKRPRAPLAAYAEVRERVIETVGQFCEKAPDPILVARALHKMLAARSPALRYRVGKDVRAGYWLRRLLPEAWFQRLMARWYRLA